jgi:hypothetical protein
MNTLGVQVSITNVFTRKAEIVDLYPRSNYVLCL